MGTNVVVIQGNLVKDPERIVSQAGTDFCKFTIANNQGKDRVSFVDVTAFTKTADFVLTYFTKGSQINVTGRLQQDTWEDKETGQKRSKLAVIAHSVDFCGKKEEADSEPF